MNLKFRYIVASALCLLTGAVFYVSVRGYMISPMLPVHRIHGAGYFGLLSGSFPSFIHALAMMLLLSAIGFDRRKAAYSCVALGVGFEVSQAFFLFGTFDFADVFAVVFGVSLGTLLYVTPNFSSTNFRRIFVYGVYGFGLLTSIASSGKGQDLKKPPASHAFPNNSGPIPINVLDPVYMTYEDLRQSFAVEKPRPVKVAGKILVVGPLLLINEPNSGVHIFNNADPTKPEPKYFLNIPGNLDLAAKNGILYADSFIDLVAIRLDGEKPELVHRVEDTFPWNPYQLCKNPNVKFDPERLDKELGVIIGAHPKVQGMYQ